jgi:hypothetical protein
LARSFVRSFLSSLGRWLVSYFVTRSHLFLDFYDSLTYPQVYVSAHNILQSDTFRSLFTLNMKDQ